MKMDEIRKKIGQDAQIFGARTLRFEGGKADGMRLTELENGAGMRLEILPDRAMDPYRLNYKGINLSFLTNVAPVAPAFADNTEASFQKHFNAGMMTTCGLGNVGVPNDFRGERKLQHGRFSTIPADEYASFSDVDPDGTPVLVARGTIREARFFGETLTARREIRMRFGENRFTLRDRIKNEGYEKRELMLLYHCNLGYPLVDDRSRLILPPVLVTPRDAEAEKGRDEYMLFHEPRHAYAEQCFYLDCEEDRDGKVFAALLNPERELALKISFKKAELPYMTEWKQMGEKFYVVGIEPGNCHVGGAAAEDERGTLTWLEPGEEKEYGLTFEVLEGKDAMTL